MEQEIRQFPVVFAQGKWLVGGLIAYFHQERDRLRAVGFDLPPGLPPDRLDPVQIARFLGIRVEDMDWPGPWAGVATSLARLEAKLEGGVGSSASPLSPSPAPPSSTLPRAPVAARELATRYAAAYLTVSVETLEKYVQTGLLPRRNIAPPGSGKPRYRYSVGDLDRLIAQGYRRVVPRPR